MKEKSQICCESEFATQPWVADNVVLEDFNPTAVVDEIDVITKIDVTSEIGVINESYVIDESDVINESDVKSTNAT